MKTKVAGNFKNENRTQLTKPNPTTNKTSPAIQLNDNRPSTAIQRKLGGLANNSVNMQQAAQLYSVSNGTIQKMDFQEEELMQGKLKPVQKKENNTGLPDNLKSGIEDISGYSLDDVKVHYNSDKPATLQAHAYAQGTDIHMSPGQEKHLPHEAWHVVQQKQGRVKPTMQMKGNVNVNDDVGLEKEADVMGAKAIKSEQNAFSKKKKDNVAENAGFKSTQLVQQNKLLIQAVLIDKEKAGLNARLVQQYHAAEKNGDSQSVTSKNVTVHEKAIEFYKQAKSLRKSAGKLHVDQDGGHITAIATLNDKINTRRAKIRDLKPKGSQAKRTTSSSQERGKPDHSVVIGTSDKASWVTGIPAW